MKKILLIPMLMLCVSAAVLAQGVTTATLSGIVKGQNNEGLPGANVVAVHTPSGTSYGTATRSDGRYTLPGLRVGGPYKISVSFVGYKDYTEDGINLSLGQNYLLNPTLQESGVELVELIIADIKNSILNDERTGAGTNIGTRELSALPTLSRSVGDFTRLTPQAKGLSFSGQDSRFNNFTIDGSIFNNSFGLDNLPGGQTNSTPISLDAIQEIQINLAPYDVRQGGFTGAGINAITRSGTNEFQGSVFYNIRNEKFVGGKANGEEVVTNDFSVQQRGFRFGGPILKNKLFFFINGEQERRDDPATQYTALRPGVNQNAANVTRVLASDLDNLRSYLIEKYNYDPGSYENYPLETYSNKALVRLDYNLNQNNKFSVRYNYLRSYRDVLTSNSGSFNDRRGNIFAMNFQNSNYVINNDIHSLVAEHNLLIGNKFSNNVIAGFTANRDYRSSRGGVFPLVDILQDGRNYTNFGYEPFTPNNRLDTDTWQFQDNFTYYAGAHTLTAGVNYEAFEFRNTFTPTYYGQYVFNSLQDFYDATDNNPANDPVLRRYQLTYSNLAEYALPTATTNARQMGLYLQDEYQLLDNVKLTTGLRVDIPSFKKTALENAEVAGLTFKDEYGNPVTTSTSQLPDAKPLWSPRVGFNWDVKGDRTLQVRGGSGIFSGRPAFVWISNQVGNNGILMGSFSVNNTSDYPFSPNVEEHIPANNPGQAASSYNIAVTDRDFKFPQVWRSNLAVDQQLPWGIIGSVEFIYNKEINNVNYVNINLEPSNGNLSGPDNRPTFPGRGLSGTAQNNANRVVDKITDAIQLNNVNKGRGYSATIKLEKPFERNLSAVIGYNYSYTKDMISAGSIAFSSWRDNFSIRGNNLPELAFSNNDLRHRIISSVTYRKEYAKNFASQISVFYQAQNQGRFTYRINGDVNGDQIASNDLMFVPRNASDLNFEQYSITTNSEQIIFTPEQQAAAFDAFIEQDEYLSARRGQYAERNGALMPWQFTLDLSFVQEFYLDVNGKRNTLQLRADIFNFGNLINNKWGVGDLIVNTSPLQFRNINNNGEPVYRFNAVNNQLPTSTYRTSTGLGDVWQAQLGVRYIFN